MISALAITYNEEINIEDYIKSLYFADEIIIVDSFSSDKTLEIANKYNVKVIQRKFTNFSDQKNFALTLAKHDWVVFFDLDEKISDELVQEIKTLKNSNPKCSAYRIKRNFYFMGKRIKYSGFQTDYSVRFFNKKHCKYNGDLVHENIVTSHKIGRLKHELQHHSYKSFDNYNNKLSHYSKLQAQELFDKNIRPTISHLIFRPLYRFMHQYLVRLGFLDGKEGFILSYIHAFSVFKRYLQLWLMYRKLN